MGCTELSIRLLCQQQLGMFLGLCCGTEEEGVVGNHVCLEQTQSRTHEGRKREDSTDRSTRKQNLGTDI